MTFDQIFTAYYNLYRADADVPTSSDDEYAVGMRMANEAINHWANFEGTYWKELFTTAQTNSTGGVVALATGVRTYAAPTAMREAGGYIKILNGSDVQQHIPIVDPQEVQFRNENSRLAYFTGNPTSGYTLNLNVTPSAAENGYLIDYAYYKKPTEFTTGSSTTEMSNPYFIVHRMLGQQFRAARNPYYSSAIRDAENALRNMQVDNNSGTWANPIKLADRSGSMFGSEYGGRSGAPW